METDAVTKTTRFVDDPESDTLWVIFMPERVNNDEFKMLEVLQPVAGKKLFMSLRERDSFAIDSPQVHRDNVDRKAAFIREMISSKNIQRVICWGYSRGAYCSILIGQLISADRIVAISPELVLGKPHSKSWRLKTSPHNAYAELIPFIESFDGEKIDLLMPCFSPSEGFNVHLARTITNKLCSVHYFLFNHNIQRKLENHPFLHEMVASVAQGKSIEFPVDWIAPKTERALAKASYDLYCSNADKRYRIPSGVDDTYSLNYEWFILKSNAYAEMNEIGLAIAAAERAAELNPRHAENWAFLANLFLKVRKLEKAKHAADRALKFSEKLVAAVEVSRKVEAELAKMA